MKFRRSPAAAKAKAPTCQAGAGSGAAAAESVDAVTVRWLQYAGLQHLASSAASADHHCRLRSLLAQVYNHFMSRQLKAEAEAEAEAVPNKPLAPRTETRIMTCVLRYLDSSFPSLGYGAQIAEGNRLLSSLLTNSNFSTQSGPDAYDASYTTEQDVATEGAIHGSCSPKLTGKLGTGLLDLHAMDDTELLSEVRKRPLSKKEISRKEGDIISVDDNAHIVIQEPKLKVDLTAYVEKHQFRFDAVLDENATTDEVYSVTVEPIVPAIFQRGKVTCFAFGQTGSGKTFTMQPLPLKASEDIFRLLRQTNYRNQNLKLWLSYFEIYCGKLFDLLNDRRQLCMREDGRQQVRIVGLQEYEVSDMQIVEELIQKGNSARVTGSTGANDESSRSHAILQLTIKDQDDVNDAKRNSKKSVSKGGMLVGKISFIDLAGTERGADSIDSDRIKSTEGAEIKKSLLALKECIRALDNDQIHIPFRGSKLTEVLRDSFVGNSRTVMIACISPSTGSCEPTLNTLRYADRFKSLSKESPLAPPLRFLVESEDTYEQNNEEEEDTTIFRRKIENNKYDPMPENSNNSFRFEPNYDYSRREVGGTSSNVLEIYQHNTQNTSSGYKTHATAQFSLNIYYKEKPKLKEKHSCSSKDCGSIVSPKGYEKQQMHGSSSSTAVSRYGEEGPRREEEKDDLITSRWDERENITDIACDVYSTTKSVSSVSSSLSLAMGRNDMQSTSNDSSTYKLGSTTPRSSDIHENDNVPSVSSPSRNLMRDEKSEIRSNSPKRESGSKMATKGHIKNQIHDPCSNTSVRQYEEEAPSQDSMPEGDSNLSSFMSEDNSNERKDDGIAYDKLEKGQNNTQDTRGCTSNNDKPDYSTNYSLPQEQDINAIVEEEDPRVSSYSEGTKTTLNIMHGVSSTTDSFSSKSGNNSSRTGDGGPRSPTLEMATNDIESSYCNNSTYKSDSSMHGTLNLHERENSPAVSSPSRELNEEEKSEIQISTKKDSASKLFPKSHEEQQIRNRGSNISVSLHEEETLSQEREINPEEDALISAHVNLLENTMDLMHEVLALKNHLCYQEMNLLVEVDKPGSPIDKYVAQLSLLLSRKAADLTNLQERLVKFQLHLQDHRILRDNNIS
ncbi:Kinesin-13A [Ananas comosus]|uniref:Kinesin-13A n=1 Tax=Ananas comosus TaxID=4615 RepID=A0A199UH69_ANACO|nr:Kinesin-13A [Ananas comosus]